MASEPVLELASKHCCSYSADGKDYVFDKRQLLAFAAALASHTGEAEPVRECGNGECGWKGTTNRMLGSVGPLCPDCGETTESAATPAAPGEVTDAMVDAYLKANDAYWKRTDELPKSSVKWRNGTPREATRESLIAALSNPAPVAAPAPASGWKPMPTQHTPAMVDAFENAMDHSHGVTYIKNFAKAYSALLNAAPASEAVAEVVSKFGDPEAFGEREIKVLSDLQKLPYGTKLYATPTPGDSADAPVQQAGDVREAGRAWAYAQGHEYPGESADAYLEGHRAALKGEQPVESSGTERGAAQ